eukprot:869879-Rhodomonas_salina.2
MAICYGYLLPGGSISNVLDTFGALSYLNVRNYTFQYMDCVSAVRGLSLSPQTVRSSEKLSLCVAVKIVA